MSRILSFIAIVALIWQATFVSAAAKPAYCSVTSIKQATRKLTRYSIDNNAEAHSFCVCLESEKPKTCGKPAYLDDYTKNDLKKACACWEFNGAAAGDEVADTTTLASVSTPISSTTVVVSTVTVDPLPASNTFSRVPATSTTVVLSTIVVSLVPATAVSVGTAFSGASSGAISTAVDPAAPFTNSTTSSVAAQTTTTTGSCINNGVPDLLCNFTVTLRESASSSASYVVLVTGTTASASPISTALDPTAPFQNSTSSVSSTASATASGACLNQGVPALLCNFSVTLTEAAATSSSSPILLTTGTAASAVPVSTAVDPAEPFQNTTSSSAIPLSTADSSGVSSFASASTTDATAPYQNTTTAAATTSPSATATGACLNEGVPSLLCNYTAPVYSANTSSTSVILTTAISSGVSSAASATAVDPTAPYQNTTSSIVSVIASATATGSCLNSGVPDLLCNYTAPVYNADPTSNSVLLVTASSGISSAVSASTADPTAPFRNTTSTFASASATATSTGACLNEGVPSLLCNYTAPGFNSSTTSTTPVADQTATVSVTLPLTTSITTAASVASTGTVTTTADPTAPFQNTTSTVVSSPTTSAASSCLNEGVPSLLCNYTAPAVSTSASTTSLTPDKTATISVTMSVTTTSSIGTTLTTLTSITAQPLVCNGDNCLRNLQDPRYSASASIFCAAYTTSVVTATSAIPTYLGNCQKSPSRVSSACSCLMQATPAP